MSPFPYEESLYAALFFVKEGGRIETNRSANFRNLLAGYY